jgi:tetratricopeptide (TPR) repeat protein
MFCQSCGARNPDDGAELCTRCNAKLLVVSGGAAVAEEGGSSGGEELALEEHLLERISTLEEVVRREGEMIRSIYESYQRLEKSLSVTQTGVVALQESLEQRGILTPGETLDRWQARSEERLHAVEARDRMLDRRDRILAGFRGSDREQFGQTLREAEVAILSLDPDRGLRLLHEAFRLDRGNADLGFFLAESWFAEGDLDRAGSYLRRVLSTSPEHYESLLYSGIVASESGEARLAETHLRRAIEIRPEGFLSHFALGGLLARQARFDEARAELNRAREIAPIPAVRILLGQVLREVGESGSAAEQFEEALREDPRNEEAHFQLGLVLLEKNRTRRALEEFQKALEINPKRLEAQEAVRMLQSGRRGGLPPVAGPAAEEFRRAEESAALGRLRQALEFYRRALEQDPGNGTVRVSYASLCASLGMTREAISACRRILANGAEEMVAAAACSTLAGLLRGEGRAEEAARVVRRFLDAHDSPTARTIGFYELASNLADREENLAEALDYATRSLEAAPDELKPFSLSALGWVYFKKKDYETAIDFLKRSSEGSATPTTLHRLGMAYLAAGRSEEAMSAFRKSKTVAARGARLEDRILDQVRSNLRMMEKASPRRKA